MELPVSRARLTGWLAALLLFTAPQAARPQSFQAAPFGGYRCGGDLYEVITGAALDVDGAASYGVTLDLFVGGGTSLTFLYSRQQTRVVGNPDAWGSRVDYGTLSIDHWHVGGTAELDRGAVRPFLDGTIGLTRFGGKQDSEIRFSAAGGAGVKLLPSPHIGARLDARVYAVFVDGDLGYTICGGYGCLVDVDVDIVWQAEFTAGLVVSF